MFNSILLFFLTLVLMPESAPDGWKQIAPGMDIKTINTKTKSNNGDSQISVVRIDPRQWELVFKGINQPDESEAKTVREWCESNNLTAAINAGMFASDYETHVGYFRIRDRVYNSHVNSYKSVMAFDPHKGKEVPPFRIFDLDAEGITIQAILEDYGSAVQNLRLIKKPGINVWNQQEREWSEAAIGEDNTGHILFIFSRSPFTMHDLNKELLKSGIGIVAAQHVEGGPEAQLYIKAGNFELEIFGSFETSYNEDDRNGTPWPIPNILGVRPKKQVGK
jgi:hypothetical protein